jgi:DNA-binding NarL/FixJ family response regulator
VAKPRERERVNALAVASGRPLDRVSLRVLTLLVFDMTYDQIARELHLSVRGVGSRAAAVKRALEAPTWFVAGMRAVPEYVDRQRVVSYAISKLALPVWMAPEGRQVRILGLMAVGHDDEQVAAELGISPRTVRRQVSMLMAANGVRTRVAAGALFRALGWV